jgi:GTP pyrophosphokinase
VPPGLAQESLNVFAPLANRLGIWQVKWAVEDLAFRFLEPQTYHDVAKQLDYEHCFGKKPIMAISGFAKTQS